MQCSNLEHAQLTSISRRDRSLEDKAKYMSLLAKSYSAVNQRHKSCHTDTQCSTGNLCAALMDHGPDQLLKVGEVIVGALNYAPSSMVYMDTPMHLYVQ